jgi:ABC-type protease/lipase transport system fused ATPase/permease subunit
LVFDLRWINNFELLVIFLIEIRIGMASLDLLRGMMIIVVCEFTEGGHQMLVTY